MGLNTLAEDAPVPPAALEAYLQLDLSAGGSIGRSLLEGVAKEAAQSEIVLSDILGRLPAHLTPHMSDWYLMHIAPVRDLAVHAVSSLFRGQSDRNKGDGFLLQCRLGAIEEDHLSSKRACYTNHAQKNYTDTNILRELEEDIARDAYAYNVKKAALGRDAVVLNRPLYLGVLFFVVFGSEALINLESFQALPWATPAIAWGATILIGLAIGLAAHYHGTVFKQFGYWFGAAEDDSKRGPAWRMVLGGATILSLSLAFVYYARSAYLLAYVGSLSGFGRNATDGAWIIGGSLLGNLIVYLVGVLWAYLLHDHDPEFSELRKRLDRNRSKSDHLKRKLERLQRRDIEQLNALFKRRTEETQRSYTALMGQNALAWPLNLFRQLQAKDDEVVALLKRYGNLLIQDLGDRIESTKFVLRCDDPHLPRRLISARDYQQQSLKLKFAEDS